jgi:hypothetical protein
MRVGSIYKIGPKFFSRHNVDAMFVRVKKGMGILSKEKVSG